jgi:hypothetical protein
MLLNRIPNNKNKVGIPMATLQKKNLENADLFPMSGPAS